MLLGAHFGVWISSLYFTSTAASVALVATQPVFAAIFARALGDTIRPREMSGVVVAVLGCLALGGGDALAGSTDALIGDLLAILGAATAAGYLLVGRRLRESLPLTPYLAMVNTVAAVVLLAAVLLVDAPFAGFAAHVYLAMALVAIVPSLVGHTLLNWSVRRTPAHMVSLAILGEPIGASLMTWAAFDEVPPIHVVAGGAIVLLGIAVAFGGRHPAPRSKVTTPPKGGAQT
jgi:drug/metabolite transporter (DMT)-like permease